MNIFPEKRICKSNYGYSALNPIPVGFHKEAGPSLLLHINDLSNFIARFDDITIKLYADIEIYSCTGSRDNSLYRKL